MFSEKGKLLITVQRNPVWRAEWERRVQALESEGLTRSDAQGAVDVELLTGRWDPNVGPKGRLGLEVGPKGKHGEYIPEWLCRCGNTSHLEGFHPCTPNGGDAGPVGSWQGHYRCDRCGLVVAM